MPRKKHKSTDPRHVDQVEKMKRRAKSGRKSAKPRVRLGSPEASALGIRRTAGVTANPTEESK